MTSCLSTLINVAGVLQDQATGLKPERSLRGISSANLQQSFAVNTIGPILVARTFMPLLSRFGKDNECVRVAGGHGGGSQCRTFHRVDAPSSKLTVGQSAGIAPQ